MFMHGEARMKGGAEEEHYMPSLDSGPIYSALHCSSHPMRTDAPGRSREESPPGAGCLPNGMRADNTAKDQEWTSRGSGRGSRLGRRWRLCR